MGLTIVICLLPILVFYGYKILFARPKTPIQRINKALSELITTEGCMRHFMKGFAGAKSVSLYDHEIDKGFRLWLFASQSNISHYEEFYLKIFFKSGEQIEWVSNNLHDNSKNWINWEASKKVYMQKPEVYGGDLYEDTIISTGNLILGTYVDDLVDSVYKVINGYKESQANKNKEFRETYLGEIKNEL